MDSRARSAEGIAPASISAVSAWSSARSALGDAAAHAAGDRGHGVARATADDLDDPLPRPAQSDRALRQLGIGLDHAEKIACRAAVAEQEVGTGQEEEVQRVVLGEPAEVEDLPQHLGCRRDLHAEERVGGLDRREMVRDRAHAADAARDQRHLPDHTAFEHGLEPAELGDVEVRAVHHARVVQVERHTAVAFDPLGGGKLHGARHRAHRLPNPRGQGTPTPGARTGSSCR